MSLTSYPANPGLFTVTLYPVAGASEGASNTPASEDFKVRCTPLDALETTTSASGITAPEASRTVPEISARPAWPHAMEAAAASRQKQRVSLTFMIEFLLIACK